MKDLLIEVQTSEFLEYNRASKKFGETNNSSHESYAVIKEEFEEAKEKQEDFESLFNRYWTRVKNNMDEAGALSELRSIAEHAAAEWIQVAAMCYKATAKKPEAADA